MKRTYLWFLVVFPGLFSCAATRNTAEKPKEVPLMREYSTITEDTLHITGEPKGIVTLPQALQLALMRNPALSAFSLEIRAREAAALQAALFPNPTLMVEVENFAGSGPYSSFRSSETTISVGQLVQISGKRVKQANVAALSGDISAWDYESKRLDVYSNVVIAYNNVLAAQERVALIKEILKLNEDFKRNIIRLIEAGRTSPVEQARADVEIANTRIELQRRERELAAVRMQLAATWGAARAEFDEVRGNLDYTVPVPSIKVLKNLLKQNPDLNRWQAVQEQSRAVSELARAERIPDPSVGAGYRFLSATNDRAFVAGITVPLKIFNRNQGAIEEAEIRVRQSKQLETAARINLQAELGREYEMLKAAYQSVKSLKEEVIPQAQQAFDGVNRGYEQGKFGFLDVLDARRTLFSSREAYLKNLQNYQETRSRIERLIGQSLENIE